MLQFKVNNIILANPKFFVFKLPVVLFEMAVPILIQNFRNKNFDDLTCILGFLIPIQK